MRNLWAVATRELRSYFLSPLAYVVIALFLLLSGYLFALILNSSREATLRPLISNVSVLFLFIILMGGLGAIALENCRQG